MFFVDDGISGTSFARSDFQRIHRMAEEGKIGTIIVKDRSRFRCEHIEGDRLAEIIYPTLGVTFISIQENVNGTTGEGMEMRPFYNIFDEWYAKQTSEKIRAVWKSKAKHGKRVSATVILSPETGGSGKINLSPCVQIVRSEITAFNSSVDDLCKRYEDDSAYDKVDVLYSGTSNNMREILSMMAVRMQQDQYETADDAQWPGWNEENTLWCKGIFETDWSELYTGMGVGRGVTVGTVISPENEKQIWDSLRRMTGNSFGAAVPQQQPVPTETVRAEIPTTEATAPTESIAAEAGSESGVSSASTLISLVSAVAFAGVILLAVWLIRRSR